MQYFISLGLAESESRNGCPGDGLGGLPSPGPSSVRAPGAPQPLQGPVRQCPPRDVVSPQVRAGAFVFVSGNDRGGRLTSRFNILNLKTVTFILTVQITVKGCFFKGIA